MKKTTQFRTLLNSDKLEFLCEAHNGLSARIVEEAGFKGIWGSGLSLSAQFGVRDNNEASWTQVLEMLEFMSDVTSVPILLDGDTGYGNFNNMQRLVRKLEQRGIAAVCIEDKLFPKTNSFIRGSAQPLANMEEFCGKIKAGKDAQSDDEFSVIARVEAFIAGWGLDEALRRAESYHAAGADAILIHSALSVPDEVLAFKKEWADRSPVVIVPTKYYATPTDVFREYGFSIAIWANQILRSSITGMQKAVKAIFEAENLLAVEDRIVPVREVFRLQGADDLELAEKRYLPRSGKTARAVVLAASRGKELESLTEEKPKAMVQIVGRPLLSYINEAYNAVGIKDITVVRGYRKATVDLPGLSYVDNEDYENTGELCSLKTALDTLNADTSDLIVSYGDVLFKKYIPQMLQDSEADMAIVVDTAWQNSSNTGRYTDFVQCSEPYSRDIYGKQVRLKRMAPDIPAEKIHGEWMGFVKIKADVLPRIQEELYALVETQGRKGAKMDDLLNACVERGYLVDVLYTSGHWLDIDNLDDLERAGSFV